MSSTTTTTTTTSAGSGNNSQVADSLALSRETSYSSQTSSTSSSSSSSSSPSFSTVQLETTSQTPSSINIGSSDAGGFNTGSSTSIATSSSSSSYTTATPPPPTQMPHTSATTSASTFVVLPTTSNTNANTTPTIISGYRCYRQIPFPIVGTSESLQNTMQQSSSEYEPDSKRLKPNSGVPLTAQLVSFKEHEGIFLMDSGGGGNTAECRGGRYSSGLLSDRGLSNSNIYLVHKKLEERIGGILCCTVCLDLPKTAIYQCTNGHLMCAGCFSHLLADARLKDEQATCPNCRCEISKTSCCRNLAVEKTLSELPASCAYCQVMLSRHCLDNHQRNECYERPTKCIYQCIGCTWEGPYHELEAHSEQCAHPNRPAREIVGFLKEKDADIEQDQQAMSQLVNFLSLEKVCFNDLQFKQYKTDEITPKLYFETNRFSAFFHQWVLKARVNDNMKSPNLTSNRFISFQLILKSKLTGTPPSLDIKFCILRGPFGEVSINPRVYSFEFNPNKLETDYIRLSINPEDCNKLLASKTINFRFFMFQS